jgi:tetratricopeptide (TPR) repeat protein
MAYYENLNNISFRDILDDEGFINLEKTYDIINNIVDQYMKRERFQEAKPLLSKLLSYYGKFSVKNSHLMSRPNPYWIIFLEQYSFYCAVYARCLLQIKDYQNAVITACAAASINPNLKDGLLNECNAIAVRSTLLQGKAPMITLEQLMKQNPLSYYQCVEQLKSYLSRNKLPS